MIAEGQQDIAENPDNPAVVPPRALRSSELVELKILARTAKESVSALWADLESLDVVETFDDTQSRVDDTGRLCDEIITHCTEELWKVDLPKKKKVPK
ncbi:hypothetical protein [Methanoregula sp.]|uniref:hypothetical protein n=1 Tax=Methanoregula sp. TaxID=2052170 RepID=UPI0035691A98